MVIVFLGLTFLFFLFASTSMHGEERVLCTYYLDIETDPPEITMIPGEGWYAQGAEVTIDASEIVMVSAGVQYRFGYWDVDDIPQESNPINISMCADHLVTAHYLLQHYLTVISPYGSVGGEGWYDNGTTALATLDTGSVDHGNGTRRIFTSWSGDTSGTDYAKSTLIYMNESKSAIANWKTQHYLTITSTLGGVTDPSGSGWYDAETLVSAIAIPEIGYLFDHWQLDGIPVDSSNPYNVTMNTAHRLHAVFSSSPAPLLTYYLTVKTAPINVISISGQGWYEENENVSLTAPDYVDIMTGIRCRFINWGVDGVQQEVSDNLIAVFMNGNHTAIAHYVLQYYLTVETDPSGLVFIPGGGWYDESKNVSLMAPSVAGYSFLYWSVDGVPREGLEISVAMNAPHTAIAKYVSKQAIIGGSTFSAKSPLLHAWIGATIVLLVSKIMAAFWIRKKCRGLKQLLKDFQELVS